MRKIFKPCQVCKGTGCLPVAAKENSSAIMAGTVLYHETCQACHGTGMSDEVLGFVEDQTPINEIKTNITFGEKLNNLLEI
jgi:mono/diheme cytochrome c family protein